MVSSIRLGVNIDHVATVRNARGGVHPCPVRAALLAAEAGADGITAHLREDRRHIRDEDMFRLKKEVKLPLNFEMAATEEMRRIALEVMPNAVCLVPEKRTEVTTEGGLDVAGHLAYLKQYIEPLKVAGIRISLFIAPNTAQLNAAAQVGADIVELHTGRYCEAMLEVPPPAGGRLGGGRVGQDTDHSAPTPTLPLRGKELKHIQQSAKLAESLGLECHAGHGLAFDSVRAIAAIPEIVELNIGHFLMGEAIFTGLGDAIAQMKKLMQEART